jgi:hypothetical protein
MTAQPRRNDMNAHIINSHPADELALVRMRIKDLEVLESNLRAVLMAGTDEDRDGKEFRAFILVSNRETVDKAAMIAALGREVVEPFIKTAAVKTLKVARKET